ncbi:MAG: PrgI family protein [Patescibacteria group bacterium]
MDQHPVPQNISSYEFRLVGDMTLKQFLQLAGGCGVGVFFYKLPLPFIVKWPLIFVSVGIGILLAFVPVQGRSFSQWLLAFIRAVYAPTEYYWKPENIAQSSLLNTQDETIQNKISVFETSFIDKINKFVSGIRVHKPFVNTSPPTPSPNLGEGNARGEVLKTASVEKTKTETVIFENEPPTPTNTTPLPPPNLGGGGRQDGGGINEPPIPTPITQTISLALITDLVPTPENPNILTGLVHTHDDKILEGAIVEIINQETGMPVRALRSNKLGQFTIATPLSMGKYIINSELDKYIFEPVLLEVKNEILKPILIKANI